MDVRTPVAGTWTAVVNDVTGKDGGYTGAVSWQAVTERYQAFGSVSPSSTRSRRRVEEGHRHRHRAFLAR